VLWDGTKLYVASHGFTTSASTSTSQNGRLWRYSYNSTTKRYTLDTSSGFTASGVPINTARSETLTIDKDSNGRLWATWTLGNQVWVTSTNGTDTQWNSPITVPGATALSADDISSLIAFSAGGVPRIGVMWSNQVDHRFWFATHGDDNASGQPAALGSGWSAAPIPGTQSSDDHINLKTLNGRVYAAVKHSTSGTTPLTSLLTRDPATGAWASATFGTGRDSHTRPIVLVDTAANKIRMFATGPQPPNTSGQSGGDIVEKDSSSLTNPSFATGVGTAVIRDNGSPDMNDVTSTKQNVTAASGLVVMGNNATTKMYWHADLVGGTTQPPPQAPVASFTATPTNGNSPLDVAFTDTSTGSPTSWSWDFGDGTTSTQQNPTHRFTNTGTTTRDFTVTLRASNAGGTSAAFTRAISVAPAPQPTLTASFTAQKAANDPLTFTFTDTSTGGTPTSWQWDFDNNGTIDSTVQNPSHTYAAAGTFTVSLTVSNATSPPDTATQQVTAGNATTGTATFSPVADTQAKSDSANTNYGTLTTLRVRGGTATSPTTYRTFLKFEVTGITGPVTKATLRLFVTDDSPDGGTVYKIDDNTWTETTLNWTNMPAKVLPATGIGSAGLVPLGWKDIDLGTAITGNGTCTLVLASGNTNSAIYSSREGTNPPQLVLTTG
jgi:PKD repeat protein